MAMEYFKAFHSYLDSIAPLNFSERGRLFTALLEYSKTGIVPELTGNERFLFPTLQANIEREKEKYAETCKARSTAGKKGGDAFKQKVAKEGKR